MSGQAATVQPDDVMAVAAGIVGDSADPAFLVSMDGKIVAWNTAACEFFGVAAWQVKDRNCAAVVRGHSPDGEVLCVENCPMLMQLRRGERPEHANMLALVGGRPSTLRGAHVHHLPVTHPDVGPLGMLHVLHHPADSHAGEA